MCFFTCPNGQVVIKTYVAPWVNPNGLWVHSLEGTWRLDWAWGCGDPPPENVQYFSVSYPCNFPASEDKNFQNSYLLKKQNPVNSAKAPNQICIRQIITFRSRRPIQFLVFSFDPISVIFALKSKLFLQSQWIGLTLLSENRGAYKHCIPLTLLPHPATCTWFDVHIIRDAKVREELGVRFCGA